MPVPNASNVAGPGRHVPELDGIRGLAIAAVMALHFVCNQLVPQNLPERFLYKVTTYGVWGVDLFFVLSGFLITGILFDAKGRAHYFRSFYMRRTLRIFPLYYAVLIVFLVLIPERTLHTYAPDILEVRRVQAWLWSYLTNVYLAAQGDFSIPYVSHFWTLAIEEHFYLVWPFVVGFCSRRSLLYISAGLSFGALMLRIVLAHAGVSPLSLQVLTPCRLDALCAGAWFALMARGPGGMGALALRARRWLPWSAGALLATSVWHATVLRWDETVLALRTSLLALFFAVFMVLSASEDGPPLVKRLLRLPALVMLGKYSYGLYVFHGIIAYAMHKHALVPRLVGALGSNLLAVLVLALVGTVLSLLVAIASYELFEARFLRLKKWFET